MQGASASHEYQRLPHLWSLDIFTGFLHYSGAACYRIFSRYLVITACNKRSTSPLVEMRDRIQRWLNPLETGLNSTYNGAKRIGSRHYHQVTFNYRHFQGVYFLNERLFTAAELIRVEWGDPPGGNGTPGKSHGAPDKYQPRRTTRAKHRLSTWWT